MAETSRTLALGRRLTQDSYPPHESDARWLFGYCPLSLSSSSPRPLTRSLVELHRLRPSPFFPLSHPSRRARGVVVCRSFNCPSLCPASGSSLGNLSAASWRVSALYRLYKILNRKTHHKLQINHNFRDWLVLVSTTHTTEGRNFLQSGRAF